MCVCTQRNKNSVRRPGNIVFTAKTICEAIAINVYASFARSVLQKDLAERLYVSVLTDASNRGNEEIVPTVVRYALCLD